VTESNDSFDPAGDVPADPEERARWALYWRNRALHAEEQAEVWKRKAREHKNKEFTVRAMYDSLAEQIAQKLGLMDTKETQK
jgi:hypothetical protein